MIENRQISPAIFWSTLEILSTRGIGFLISIVLARLILPEEFGLIAMLMLFTAVASLFVEGGFSSSLIQRQDHNYTDECTVFWFNLFAGAVAALILVLIAPWIASFYERPILKLLTILMAFNLWLSAFLTVPTALLAKKLDFQTLMKVNVSAVFISGALAIYLALSGWGVWAIAIQTLSSTLVSGLVLWSLSNWRPSLRFSWKSFGKLFNFGGYVLLASLIDRISTQFYTLIIGKSYGALELGYFHRATSTKDLPQGILSGIFSRVAFPVFSSQSGDIVQLKKSLQIALITTMAVNLPVMAGLMMTADELVLILFGPRWEAVIPILKVLCGLGAFWPLHVANVNVLMAMGHSRLMLKIEIIKKTLFIATIILSSQISVIAIAWGMFALGLLGVFINTWYSKKFLSYGTWDQLQDLKPYLFVTFGMILAIAVVQYVIASILKSDAMILIFLAKFMTGVMVYGALTYLFKLGVLNYFREFIQQFKNDSIPLN